MSDLVRLNKGELQELAQYEAERAHYYAERSRADNTHRAYKLDWGRFCSWCESASETFLPAHPLTVARYLGRLADEGYSVSTIERSVASINKFHDLANVESPGRHGQVRAVVDGIRRSGEPSVGKTPLLIKDLRAILAKLGDSLIDERDRFLLVFGINTALRRSELVNVMVKHVTFVPEGFTLHIPKSKTDQRGRGENIAISSNVDREICPRAAIERWQEVSGIKKGYLLVSVSRHGRAGVSMTENSVNLAVKKLVKTIGLDEKLYGAHSLRAGFVTQADLLGFTEQDIRQITRHKSGDMVRRYIRRGLFDRPVRLG